MGTHVIKIEQNGFSYSKKTAVDERVRYFLYPSNHHYFPRIQLFFGGGLEPDTIYKNGDIWPYKVVRDKDLRQIKFGLDDSITIEDVMKEGIFQLKIRINDGYNKLSKVVLIVPSFFNVATRQAIRSAFQFHDIEVIDLLNGTQSAVEYCSKIKEKSCNKYIIAIDEGTGEMTILSSINQKHEIIAVCELFEMCSERAILFDNIMYEFLRSIYEDIDIKNEKFIGELKKTFLSICEFQKGVDPSEIHFDILDGSNIEYTITATKRNYLLKVFTDRITTILQNLFIKLNITHEDISDVVYAKFSYNDDINKKYILDSLTKFILFGNLQTQNYEYILRNLETIYSKSSISKLTDSLNTPSSNATITWNETTLGNMIEQMKLRIEFQQLELELSTTKQHELNYRITVDQLNIEHNELKLEHSSTKKNYLDTVSQLNAELDELRIGKKNEAQTVKFEDTNKTQEESRIAGVDFTQKRCKVAFVDQTESFIWESVSEFEVKQEDLVRMFKELKNEQSINSGVVAVNGNLTNSERRDLISFATMLQFSVLRIVNDTTAILAANGCFNDAKNRYVLILDIDYERFQMTVLKVENQQPKILIKSTTDQFTEVQFDEAIFKYCSEQFHNLTGLDLVKIDSPGPQKALQRLREISLEAKQRLSVLDATRIDIGALYQDHDFNIKFSRTTCQFIVCEFFKDIPKYIVKGLTERNLQYPEITDVILIGDFAQFLDHMISECFYNAIVHKTEDSNEIVARGAAILAKAALENPIVEFDQFIEPKQAIIQ